jgi:hypothetical protein
MMSMRRHGSAPAAPTRLVGLVVGAVALVLATTVVGAVGAAGQTADQAPPPSVVTPAPDPAAPPPLPDGTAPLINETPPPPAPPEPDPSPRIRVSLGRLAVMSAQTALTERQADATRAREAQARDQAALDGAGQVRAAAERRLSDARDQLGSTAVYAYMHTPGDDVMAGLRGDATASGEERRLFAAAVDRHEAEVVDAERGLERATARLDAAQQALDRSRQAADDQDRRVEEAATVLADARREVRTATAEEERPPSPTSWELTLAGPSAFTAEELTRWYDAQARGSLASVPVADLVRLFVDHGTAEGIRGDMAFAQAVHETGWFANRDTILFNNFAGIGHCDSCSSGFPFATADIGVLAQIQLLKSYDQPNPTYGLPRAAPNLNGPRGCCQTWTELGGVWATDPNYGPRILSIYAGMLDWLVAQRSTPPPSP